MNIIFCLSYTNIPYALDIIYRNKNYLVVTSNKRIEEFFKSFFDEKKVIKIPNLSFEPSFKFPIQLIILYFYKIKIWRHFKRFKNRNVYIFFVAFAFFEGWLVKKMSFNNKIYLSKAVKVKIYEKRSFYAILSKKILNIVYNIDVIPNYNGNRIIYNFTDKFYEDIAAISYPVNKNIHNDFKKKLRRYYNLDSYDIIIFLGGIVETNYTDRLEYVNKMREIVDLMKNYNSLVKFHPRYKKIFMNENELPSLSSFIPGNLVLDCFDYVISSHSSVLFEAANKNLTAISLLRFFNPINKALRDHYINYLNDNLELNAKIYYPENLEELKHIIGL